MSPPPALVVVAEDHPVYREGIVRLIEADPRFELVAAVGDGREALAEIRGRAPAVAVLDIGLPGIGGIEIMEAITREHLPTRAVCLSALEDSVTVHRAISAGARAFLPKGSSGDEIVEAVSVVADGGSLLPRAVHDTLTMALRQRSEVPAGPVLSTRELEVLRLASDGLTVSAIAQALIIGDATVKTHLQHIYDKFGVSDRAAAVAHGFRLGFLR
ncbi:response regulator transcription factor [Conexibacter woesei]|uniref:Two component transcriptional regulator, LuxR family n=1 Tax=Conexibacter woesei (strain DSM 14684 / CCUG 47730 / CIP 108061 / JCM 11494 / NBRC 100937 / ID131577) TaxID=469383 RepID=D3F702_CONWI|nr:response regulator transcription factor [Conexibacter woesei]ADB52800.1 two component transcriptional regulator, LuxR family [Conexibacter woesei DSM 14684]